MGIGLMFWIHLRSERENRLGSAPLQNSDTVYRQFRLSALRMGAIVLATQSVV